MSAAACLLRAPLEAGLRGIPGVPRPALALDFRRMASLPPTIGLTRDGPAWRRGSSGLLEAVAADVPAFEHDAGGAGEGWRIEGARTNLCTNNGTLTALPKGPATSVTAQPEATGPDGQTGAVYRIVMGAVTNTYLRLAEGVPAGTWTVSLWARSQSAAPGFQFFANGGGVPFSTMLSAGPAWQRYSYSFTSTGTGDIGFNNGDDSYATDVEVWRPQVEAGGHASSLVVTSGTATSRAADLGGIAALDHKPGIAARRGTWLVEWLGLEAAPDFSRILELNDGSADNQISLARGGSGLAFNVVAGGVFQASLSAGSWSGGRHRAVFRHARDDFAVCLDGGPVAADAEGNMPPLTGLLLGRSIGSGWSFSTLVRLLYWAAPLPDAALARLSALP